MTASRALKAKVCGLTRHEDVETALRAGADFVGFVSFPPSPRHLANHQLIALSDQAAQSTACSVLVTVDADRDWAERLIADARFDAVQLCGDERPADWVDCGFKVMRRIAAREGALDEVERWRKVADLFVLDHPASAGGSGRTVDAALAASIAGSIAGEIDCLLAGGLTPDAVEAGLAPRLLSSGLFGLDASSGLERTPGVKDDALVERFVRETHATQSIHAHTDPRTPKR